MRALVVDDEVKLAKVLGDYLQAHGFTVELVHDGAAAIQAIKTRQPDIVLLDIGLPGQDGLAVCRDVRRFSQVPIVFVTARVDDIDRILGLELGADDYICKPYNLREVVARINAVLRRVAGRVAGQANLATRTTHDGPQNCVTRGPLTIDQDKMVVSWTLGDKQGKIDATPVEFRLLWTLANAPDRVFSRRQLMDRVYEDDRVVTERTLDSHIKNLRKKCNEVGIEVIESIYGVGYRYATPDV